MSVLRTPDMLAYTEVNPVYGTFLVVDYPPASIKTWEHQHALQFSHIDPWVNYAANYRSVSNLREFWNGCRTIESEEEQGLVLLRFLRSDTNGRIEIYCDKNTEYLPVKTRAGENRGKQFVVFSETASEWSKVNGFWFPVHYLETIYYGPERKPIKNYDLVARNLRVNDAAAISDSAFKYASMDMPEGSFGVDRRKNPPTQLIRSGGTVRVRRQDEKLETPKDVGERLDREREMVAARENKEAEAILRVRSYWNIAAWTLAITAVAMGTFVVGRMSYRLLWRTG